MEKIIFLDVDGVLNSEAWYMKTREVKIAHPDDNIDPAAVERLNRIVEPTGAKIVVSSTWRRGILFDLLKRLLEKNGFVGEIIGTTTTDRCDMCYRGNQIHHWIRNHEEIVGKCWNYRSYVILDDDSDMLYWQKDNFIKTNGKYGLADADVEKAIAILNADVPVATT